MIVQLPASKRNPKVKASTLRQEGIVPGCIFGKEMESLAIQMPFKDLKKCLDQKVQKVELVVDGEEYLAGVDEVQRGNLLNKLIHVSFHALKRGEIATLTVPVEIIGTALGVKEGGVVASALNEITIKGLPKNLPDKISVDISELALGDSIKVQDYAKKYEFEFLDEDMDKVLATCHYPKVQEPEATDGDDEVDAAAADSADKKPEDSDKKDS